jgi:hypothetical protein
MERKDLEEIRRLAALRSPAMMGRYAMGRRYQLRDHITLIDRELTQLGPERNRLLVLCPPRAGKSQLVGQLLPLWWMARKPTDRVVIASYAASLANTHSRAVRRMVADHGETFGMRLRYGEQREQHWSLDSGGGLVSAGIGGGLTGKDMDLGIIDDPVAGRAEADSRVYRDRAWEWWSSVFMTRRSPGAPTVMILTRWHLDDLAGRVLDHEGRVEEGGKWKVVHLEAIASGLHPDPLGRAPGDPLPHPRISDDRDELLAYWEDIRTTEIPRDWSALYMGSPVAAEGALVDGELMRKQTHLTGHPEPLRSAVAVDPSGGGKDSAGVVAGFLGNDGRVWVTHDRTRVMASDQWAREACLLAVEVDADRIVFEKNYGGDLVPIAIKTAWESLVKEDAVPDGMRMPYLHHVVARKGKFLRAEPVAQMYREDKVRHSVHLAALCSEWEGWRPGDTDSPGRIDASVYLVRDLMPTPGGTRGVASAVGVNREAFKGAGGIVRRPY